MAVERHPSVRGFTIQVNAFNATCDNGSPASLATNTAVANAVVSNPQNVAVIGHACSAEAIAWLPIYQAAGTLTINGSTTGAFVAPSARRSSTPPRTLTRPSPTVVSARQDAARATCVERSFPGALRLAAERLRRPLLRRGQRAADGDRGDRDDRLTEPRDRPRRARRRGPPHARPARRHLQRHARPGDRAIASTTRPHSLAARTRPPRSSSQAIARVPIRVRSMRWRPGVHRWTCRAAGADRASRYGRMGSWSRSGAIGPGLLGSYVARPNGGGLRVLPEPVPAASSAPARRWCSRRTALGCSRLRAARRASSSSSTCDHCTPGGSPIPARCVVVAGRLADRRARRSRARTRSSSTRAGRRRFSVPGIRALWSARDQLAVVNAPAPPPSWSTSTARCSPASRRRQPTGRLTAVGSCSRARARSCSPTRRAHDRTRVLVRGPKNWTPYEVAFTPDGAFVRYARASGGFVAIPVDGRHAAGAPRLRRLGAQRALRLHPSAPARAGGRPAACSRSRSETASAGTRGRQDDSRLTTTARRRLTWSADGSRLLYESSARAPRDLWAVDRRRLQPASPHTGRPRRLRAGLVRRRDAPRLHQRVVHGRLVRLLLDVGRHRRSDGRLQSTIPGATRGRRPGTAARRGLRMARGSWSSVCCSGDLDIVGDDGSGRRPLVPGPAGDVRRPRRLVPGRRLHRLPRLGRRHRPDRAGRQRAATPAGGAGNQAPTALAWSHDGKLLAYSAADGVHVLTVDGSAPPRLLLARARAGRPELLPRRQPTRLRSAAPRPGRQHPERPLRDLPARRPPARSRRQPLRRHRPGLAAPARELTAPYRPHQEFATKSTPCWQPCGVAELTGVAVSALAVAEGSESAMSASASIKRLMRRLYAAAQVGCCPLVDRRR